MAYNIFVYTVLTFKPTYYNIERISCNERGTSWPTKENVRSCDGPPTKYSLHNKTADSTSIYWYIKDCVPRNKETITEMLRRSISDTNTVVCLTIHVRGATGN